MKLFTSIVLVLLSFEVFSQDTAMAADEAVTEISVTNVACDSETDELTFDLTITEDGVPVEVSSSGSYSVSLSNEDETVFFGSAPSNGMGTIVLSDAPVTGGFSDGFGCDNIAGLSLTLQSQGNGNMVIDNFLPAASSTAAAPIPTLGEWGLIILIICLSVIGLVKIRSISRVPA